jgi:16S rRNA (cytosine1402-N4)-methyltransferase
MLPNLSHSSSAAVEHVPVMAPEVADLLEPRPGDTIVDCTFGAGGHAAVLEPHLRGSGTYIGIDRDHEAEPFFARFASDATSQTRFLHGDFALVLRNLVASGQRVQAILMDLGVSSMQIDRPHRGFSYANDAPLDMRMDASADLTAAEIVNTWDERDLAGVLRTFGEERYSFQIARAIARRRKLEPFERSGDLVEVIKGAIPTPARFGQGHPARRVFQALRIATNGELESLREGLELAVELLAPGGRLAVISFHSLEDRIVKQFIRDQARGCTCPPDFPVCVCGHEPRLRSLTRRAVVASVDERCTNPRSSSARLRAAERTPAP